MLQLKIDIQGGNGPIVDWRDGYAAKITGAAAGAVRNLVRTNLEARPGRQYWKEAAQHIETKITADTSAEVSVNYRGVALHFYGTEGLPGGVLKATGRPSAFTGKPTKMLLLPFKDSPLRLRRVALYEVGIEPDKVFVLKKNGRALLMANTGEGEPVGLGMLKASVTMAPDPTVLPAEEKMQTAAADAAQKTLEILRLFDR